MTKLPAPEQWVLSKMNESEVAEMIEQHIDYVEGGSGRSVHLLQPFVWHYMRRDDNALPTVVAIATLPIVLADGGLLASSSSLLKNLEMESFLILSGRCQGFAVELDAIF